MFRVFLSKLRAGKRAIMGSVMTAVIIIQLRYAATKDIDLLAPINALMFASKNQDNTTA